MARQPINIGQYPNDGTGDKTRDAWRKADEMFAELYSLASGVNHWRGAYDMSVNAYPSSGGTGDDGVPGAGDEWYVSVPGTVDVTGLGVIVLNLNATLKYKGGDPTLAASWIVKQ